jgi:ribosomal protein L19E
VVKQGEIKAKKKCCESGPRCKRCPAALRKLERRGLASRRGKRTWVISLEATKKDIKRARRRTA